MGEKEVCNKLEYFNFCCNIYKEGSIRYYDLVSVEEELIKKIPENIIYQILKGRKYKIVNLKLVNDKIVLKNTAEDLELVKRLSFPLSLLKEMKTPFAELFLELIKKKMWYFQRDAFKIRKNKINLVYKYMDIICKEKLTEFICCLHVCCKKTLTYDIIYRIYYSEEDGFEGESCVDLVDRYGGGGTATIGIGDISDYTTDNLKYSLGNLLDWVINYRGFN